MKLSRRNFVKHGALFVPTLFAARSYANSFLGVASAGVAAVDSYTRDGLVAEWLLDEGSGTTAEDTAGTHDGTLTNMDAGTDWIVDGSGYKLDFDGSDDRVLTTTQPLTAFPFTMVVKCQPTVANFNIALGIANGAGTGNYFELGIYNTEMAWLSARNGTSRNLISAINILNDSVILVGVFNSSTSRELFVDGVSAGTDTTEATFGTMTRFGIGCRPRSTPDSHWAGQISAALIYNRALSGAEITQIQSTL